MYRQLPGKFVKALFDLKANQKTKIEFQCRELSVPLPWLKNARIMAYSLREIIAATYPTLQCRLLNYEFEEGYFQNKSIFWKHDEEVEDFSKQLLIPHGARGDRLQNSRATFYLLRNPVPLPWYLLRDPNLLRYSRYAIPISSFSISKMDVFWLHQTWLQPHDENPGEVDCWITKDRFLFQANVTWALQRADDRKFLEEISLERALAFAMGCHTRLGEGSQIKNIDPELLRCIGNIVINGL